MTGMQSNTQLMGQPHFHSSPYMYLMPFLGTLQGIGLPHSSSWDMDVPSRRGKCLFCKDQGHFIILKFIWIKDIFHSIYFRNNSNTHWKNITVARPGPRCQNESKLEWNFTDLNFEFLWCRFTYMCTHPTSLPWFPPVWTPAPGVCPSKGHSSEWSGGARLVISRSLTSES